MGAIAGRHQFCRDIADALGLESVKYIQDVDIKMHVHEIVSVTVKFLPEENNIAKLPAVIKKYNLKLVEVEQEQQPEEPEEKCST